QSQHLQVQLNLKKAHVELVNAEARLKNSATLAISDFAVEEELRQDPVLKKHHERLAQIEETIQQIKAVATPEKRASALQPSQAERTAILEAIDSQRQMQRPRLEEKLRAKALNDLKETLAKLEENRNLLKEQERALKEGILRQEVQ